MGLAIDTIAGSITGAQANFTGVTLAPGDSLTVRSFQNPSYAKLEGIFYQATTLGSLRVRSPMLHDDVRGIQLTPGVSPATLLLPAEAGQMLVTQDTLTVEMEGGLAAETDVVALSIFYSNISGASARLHSWGDIAGVEKNIKPLVVSVGAPGNAGQWVDTVITATENVLHANTDYAVLGYVLDKNICAVGVRGQETGNLRVAGPGVNSMDDTSDYFVRMSDKHGTPHIPVFNSANKDSYYVSLIEGTALTAVNVQLILAELSQNLPG